MARAPKGNRLLQSLSSVDRASLEPKLTQVEVSLYQVFEEPNKRIETVFFPKSGIMSVVAEQPNRTRAEIGIIGWEGMTGSAILLGNDRSPHSTYIQAAGDGQRMSARDLRAALEKSPSLNSHFLKYVQTFMVQTAHTAIANARAKLPERLARWLLMAHDRVSGDRLSLTHEFLSLMLAVRRAGVTEALHDLESKKLIQVGRREIVLLDRGGIEKIAGAFYGTPEVEYRRLFS
jgi:CRP-like cAMP-binding protein